MKFLKKITDPLGDTQTFVTDSAGRVTQSANARGDVITYTYDIDGNRTSVSDTYNSKKEETSYSYNSLHAVTAITQTTPTNQTQFNLSYDSLGRRTQLKYPNSTLKTIYIYNKASFLTSISTRKYNGTQVAKHIISGNKWDGSILLT